ncbi:MAG TPA: sigma-70 family RNA polymerase sigma factor [Chitinophagaceae bacterium]|nr:sigma-70 family RNA polymerase sigma factor [Chitinophagaceae bacterium]
MNQQDLLPHFFRTEYRNLVAVLTRRFGTHQLQAAEDLASEAFVAALDTWPYQGIPDNPTAWLYAVARNKARNYQLRARHFSSRIAPDLMRVGETVSQPEEDLDLSAPYIADSQLCMLFAVCHPALSSDAQVALALRVLCGFGLEEIASAFLVSRETVHKRLTRARERLREQRIPLDLPGRGELAARLETVLQTIYLLFSEGYYSECRDEVLREDLCLEAMRLASQLTENPLTDQPPARALLALMCFHSSRFAARRDARGELLLYGDQDPSRWNRELISRGVELLHQASRGDRLSTYHVEAAIAYWQTVREDTAEKWCSLLQLYDQLLALRYSPVAALNRAWVVARLHGPEAALAELGPLEPVLAENPYYHALMGELYGGLDKQAARDHFARAYALARTGPDRAWMQRRLEQEYPGPPPAPGKRKA